MFGLARDERRRERDMERMERKAERRELHYERRANREMEHHLRHLERLGYDPQAFPPPAQYGGMASVPNMGYTYPPSGPVYNAAYAGPVPQGAPSGYGSPVPYGPHSGYGTPSQYGPGLGSGSPSPYAPPPYAPPAAGYTGPQQYAAPPYPPSSHSPSPSEHYPPGVAYVAQNGVHVEQEDTRKKWHELDDGKRSALATGGLIIGLAAIAGGAYYVHQKHKKEGEAMQAQAWEVQNWMMQSNQKTDSFLHNRDSPKEPTTWVYSAHIDEVKQDLIPGGEEDGRPWYIARAPHNGGLRESLACLLNASLTQQQVVGKCRPEIGAFVGADKEAVQVKAYDVLVGDLKAVKWVSHSGRLNVAELGAQPVEGGHESNGTPLAIARAQVKDDGFLGIGGSGNEGVFPGKISSKLDGAYVTVDGKEVMVKSYDVLCYP